MQQKYGRMASLCGGEAAQMNLAFVDADEGAFHIRGEGGCAHEGRSTAPRLIADPLNVNLISWRID